MSGIGQSSRWEQEGCGEAPIFSEASQCSSSSVNAPSTMANSLPSLGSYSPENMHICDATVLPCLTVIIGTFGLFLAMRAGNTS